MVLANLSNTFDLKGASTGAGLGNAFLSHVRAVDGIFQVVRAFDDAEVTHVEGDVDPLRDMEIIQTELRLKDIEWVEKKLADLKKTGRSLGSNSLADKAKKEEIVRLYQFFLLFSIVLINFLKAITEKVLKHIQEDSKDVRKGEWNNKEVRENFIIIDMQFRSHLSDDKELVARILTQLVEEGVTPQYSFEINFTLILSNFLPSRLKSKVN